MPASKVMRRVRYYAARFDLLVGFLSLALAFFLAALYSRKKGAGQDIALLARTTNMLIAGSASLGRNSGCRLHDL